jgi:hypothetical protein
MPGPADPAHARIGAVRAALKKLARRVGATEIVTALDIGCHR